MRSPPVPRCWDSALQGESLQATFALSGVMLGINRNTNTIGKIFNTDLINIHSQSMDKSCLEAPSKCRSVAPNPFPHILAHVAEGMQDGENAGFQTSRTPDTAAKEREVQQNCKFITQRTSHQTCEHETRSSGREQPTTDNPAPNDSQRTNTPRTQRMTHVIWYDVQQVPAQRRTHAQHVECNAQHAAQARQDMKPGTRARLIPHQMRPAAVSRVRNFS